MPRLIWAVLCQRILVDRETNSVSYIETIEGLDATQLPLSAPPMTLGTLWKRQSEDDVLRMRVRIEAPGDKKALSHELPEYPFGPNPRIRVNVYLGGVLIREPGEHHIIVEQRVGQEWREEVRIPLDVALVQQETPPQG